MNVEVLAVLAVVLALIALFVVILRLPPHLRNAVFIAVSTLAVIIGIILSMAKLLS